MHTHSLRLLGASLAFAVSLRAQTPVNASRSPSATATATSPSPKPQQSREQAVNRWTAVVEAHDLARAGKYNEATAHLQSQVVTKPGAAAADLQLAELVAQVATIAQNEGDEKTALKLAATAAQLSDRRNKTWSQADQAHAARLTATLSDHLLGDKKRAATAYAEVLKLAPKDKTATAALARVTQEVSAAAKKAKEQRSLPPRANVAAAKPLTK